MKTASDCSIPEAITDRGTGDVAISVADPNQAAKSLAWHTQRNFGDI